MGALSAIAGLLVGKFVDQRADRSRWLRDMESKALVEYVGAHQTMRQILRQLATLPGDSPDYADARKNRRGHWASYSTAFAAVQLHADPAVYEAAERVDKELRELSALVTRGHLGTAKWHEARLPTDSAMVVCVDKIRGRLGLAPHVTDRQAWVLRTPSAELPDVMS